MDVKDAIERRRAYRSLGPVEIDMGTVEDLAGAASMAPSCFNNQPWRFIFVTDKGMLERMQGVMSKGNEWTRLASMIVVVLSRHDLDCRTKGRDYYQFDTGMATAFLVLRATELGLVAHPIAGYSPKRAREVLGIPDDMEVITLVIVGRKKAEMDLLLSQQQNELERERPERKGFHGFASVDRYSEVLGSK